MHNGLIGNFRDIDQMNNVYDTMQYDILYNIKYITIIILL